MKPFFSVIIPTYNRSSVIYRAVKSVLNQTFNDYELIVVDDGSTDDTSLLLEGFSRIKYFKTLNKGVSAARNFGVEKSTGQYIAFLDSDDEWLPEKLLIQFDYIQSNNARFIHTDENWVRDSKIILKNNKQKKAGGDIFERSIESCILSPSTVVIERELLLKYKCFREDFIVCEDYDLWLKILSENEVGLIDIPLVNKYGGHEDQLSTKYRAMDYFRVISLDWLLKNRKFDNSVVDKIKASLLKKADILLKGYKKHNNLDDYNFINSIKNSYAS